MRVKTMISRIRGSNKWLMDDNLVSDRMIYAIAIPKASLLIKQEVNKRRLLNSDNIFTPYECLDLISVDLHECGVDCTGRARRSREKLPQLHEGIHSYTIQGVYNIDNSEEIFPTSIREYINLSKLRFKPNKLYYLVKDGYLYVLDQDVENVNIYLYSNELIDDGSCTPAYDYEFKLPTYLEDNFYALIAGELMNYHRISQDLTDNNLDESSSTIRKK